MVTLQCLRFQGHQPQQKMLQTLWEFNYFQKHFVISTATASLSLLPISLLPLDNQNPPTAHGKKKNGWNIQMAELMFPHDKRA